MLQREDDVTLKEWIALLTEDESGGSTSLTDEEF